MNNLPNDLRNNRHIKSIGWTEDQLWVNGPLSFRLKWYAVLLVAVLGLLFGILSIPLRLLGVL